MTGTSLFAPVCSITTTRRRRFLWVAWWSGAPTERPFRKPDAFEGGARTREEALVAAEKAAGMPLVEIDAKWARAWARVLVGAPPWPREPASNVDPGGAGPGRADGPRSVWQILGVDPSASLDEIKRAYRRRALETHPDHGGAPEAFREVMKAYASAVARRRAPRKGSSGPRAEATAKRKQP